jgi:hypothetical protein
MSCLVRIPSPNFATLAVIFPLGIVKLLIAELLQSVFTVPNFKTALVIFPSKSAMFWREPRGEQRWG